jgi:predicted NACHT family NTPase
VKDLGDYVMKWIAADSTKPIALLGGYGMGKTSFCRYLVAELGKAYLANAMSRVPIYVRLSDIAKQQELDGLIAKTLADRYRIKDYYFEKFLRLNEAGKFVLIFDGFDEMKHALSWSEFKFNFSQINRTIRHRAKVIVAGRPNAFPMTSTTGSSEGSEWRASA